MENVLNTDVVYQGMTFHVQTEDLGSKSCYFQTQIYYRGKILSSERFFYNDLLGKENFSQVLSERIEREHKKNIERVEKGRINTRDINPILVPSHQNDRKSGTIKIVANASRFLKKHAKSKSFFETSSPDSFVFKRKSGEEIRPDTRRRWATALLSLGLVFIFSMIAFPKLESGHSREKRYIQFLNQGQEMMEREKYKNAEELLNRAISMFPNRSQAYIQRAQLFADIGSMTQAVQDLTHASELAPGNGVIFYELGALYADMKNDKAAIQNFIKAVDVDYETEEIYDSLGAALFREGALMEAEKYWIESLRVHPNNPTVYYNLGLVAMKRESFGEAIHYFQRATENDPGMVDGYIKLGDIYYLSGLKEKAGHYWSKAHDINPQETVAQAKLQRLQQNLQ
jgi:tetratricopeptide (TPR) repeat protein